MAKMDGHAHTATSDPHGLRQAFIYPFPPAGHLHTTTRSIHIAPPSAAPAAPPPPILRHLHRTMAGSPSPPAKRAGAGPAGLAAGTPHSPLGVAKRHSVVELPPLPHLRQRDSPNFVLTHAHLVAKDYLVPDEQMELHTKLLRAEEEAHCRREEDLEALLVEEDEDDDE